MSVNGVTSSTQSYESKSTTKTKTTQSSQNTGNSDSAAAVYEKSNQSTGTKTVYKTDSATVERLKSEADQRVQKLKDLVEKMLAKQGKTFNDSSDMYQLLREGKVEVDPETRAQAQKDIAVDGYWGVEQTSERMLSFAKALSGGDPSKADELIAAVKKGFEQATKAWGGELPGICKQTLDTTIKKMEQWRDGISGDSDASSNAEQSFTGQATASEVAE